MAAKNITLDQCRILHPIYGQHDCCLCRERRRVQELEEEIERLKALCREAASELGRWTQRTGNRAGKTSAFDMIKRLLEAGGES